MLRVATGQSSSRCPMSPCPSDHLRESQARTSDNEVICCDHVCIKRFRCRTTTLRLSVIIGNKLNSECIGTYLAHPTSKHEAEGKEISFSPIWKIVLPLPEAGWVSRCLTLSTFGQKGIWEMQIRSNNSFNSLNVHIMNIITRKNAWNILDLNVFNILLHWLYHPLNCKQKSPLQPNFKLGGPISNLLSILLFDLVSRCSKPSLGSVMTTNCSFRFGAAETETSRLGYELRRKKSRGPREFINSALSQWENLLMPTL